MKRISSFVLAVLLSFNMLFPAAYASSDSAVERIDYEDGSYALVTVDRKNSRSTATEDKTYTYFSSTGEKCFAYILTATFTYNGKTSKADTCYADIYLYVKGWTCTSHSEYVSGNTTYGSAVFSGPNSVTRNVNLTITCDANGNVT